MVENKYICCSTATSTSIIIIVQYIYYIHWTWFSISFATNSTLFKSNVVFGLAVSFARRVLFVFHTRSEYSQTQTKKFNELILFAFDTPDGWERERRREREYRVINVSNGNHDVLSPSRTSATFPCRIVCFFSIFGFWGNLYGWATVCVFVRACICHLFVLGDINNIYLGLLLHTCQRSKKKSVINHFLSYKFCDRINDAVWHMRKKRHWHCHCFTESVFNAITHHHHHYYYCQHQCANTNNAIDLFNKNQWMFMGFFPAFFSFKMNNSAISIDFFV